MVEAVRDQWLIVVALVALVGGARGLALVWPLSGREGDAAALWHPA